MGNCINYLSSSSSVAAAAKEMNGIKPSVNNTMTFCDERTIESSTTTSPPVSPIKPNTNDLHVPSSQQQHNASPSKNEGETINKTPTTVIEQQREHGQKRLRDLVITGAHKNNIDWATIISLAEDLHRKEQSLLKSKRSSRINNTTFLNNSSSINRKSIHGDKHSLTGGVNKER